MKKETITPFWQRMPHFFVYPLRGWPLAMLIVGYLMVLVLSFFYVLSKLLFVVATAFCLLAFMRFAFSVLEQTALGRILHQQQDFFGGLPDGRRSRPWKLLGLLAVLAVGLAIMARFGAFAFFAASLVFSVALPACIMILAMTGDLGRALLPANVLFVLRRIGTPYFGLCGLLLLLTIGFGNMLPLVRALDKAILWLPLSVVLLLHMVLMLFYMMGYVVYQYHEALELDVEVDFAEVRRVQAGKSAELHEEERANQEIAEHIAEGRLDEAVRVVDQQRQRQPERLGWQLRYVKLLHLAGRSDEALGCAREQLRRLLVQQRLDEALDLLLAARELDPGFLPLEADDVLPLAETAWRRRLPEPALSLVKGFDQRFPRHPAAAGALLLAARILSERYRRDELSVQFLRHARQQYPASEVLPAVEQYLTLLLQLQPHLRTSGD